ncbi:MAG: 5-(carboxyamino)imidazole ribonucleotide synthase [candidate division KSB1 bacterium]|nr:5-(carboxyamino)imidazole ribonucleotide synthase [candidate division KSB1 bacterium]
MTIGILGGGQLGRMLALAGYPLGLRFRFLDPSPEAAAGQVAEHIAGSYDDHAILERFAEGLEVVTYEFENVPLTTAQFLSRRVAVYPPVEALEVAQDRLLEKNFLQTLGIPTAAFVPIDTATDLQKGVEEIGLPAVLKTRRFGYDGKGQFVLRTMQEAAPAWEKLSDAPLVLERFVPFEREVSIIAVRGRNGEIVFYPLVENHHGDGMLRFTLAPAPNRSETLQAEAETYAQCILEKLNYAGVLAIEFFQHNGRLLANEMAPRVHNSGHWTIEAAATSQFENHLRAIVGWPLGSTRATGYAAMLNLIGHIPSVDSMLGIPEVHLHLYGKVPRPGRKLGHLTLRAEDRETLAARVMQLQPLLTS